MTTDVLLVSQLAPLVRSVNLDFHLTSERCFLPTTKQSPVFLLWWILKILNMKEKGQKQKTAAPGEQNKILMVPPSQSHTLRGRKD